MIGIEAPHRRLRPDQVKESRSDLSGGGLSLHHPDPDMQAVAQAAVRTGAEELEKPKIGSGPRKGGTAHQAALIALNPHTGSIRAPSAGGTTRRASSTVSSRPIASPARSSSLSSTSPCSRDETSSRRSRHHGPQDSPIALSSGRRRRTWSPRNDDGQFRGPVTVRARSSTREHPHRPPVVGRREGGIRSTDVIAAARKSGSRPRKAYPGPPSGPSSARRWRSPRRFRVRQRRHPREPNFPSARKAADRPAGRPPPVCGRSRRRRGPGLDSAGGRGRRDGGLGARARGAGDLRGGRPERRTTGARLVDRLSPRPPSPSGRIRRQPRPNPPGDGCGPDGRGLRATPPVRLLRGAVPGCRARTASATRRRGRSSPRTAPLRQRAVHGGDRADGARHGPRRRGARCRCETRASLPSKGPTDRDDGRPFTVPASTPTWWPEPRLVVLPPSRGTKDDGACARRSSPRAARRRSPRFPRWRSRLFRPRAGAGREACGGPRPRPDDRLAPFHALCAACRDEGLG